MTSILNLADLRARVRQVLVDAGATAWEDSQLDQALRLALEEYSRASLREHPAAAPRRVIAALTPGAGAREIDLSTLAAPLLALDRVWFPYNAAVGESPVWARFELWRDEGKPVLFLPDACGDGVSSARLFYRAAHALAGLNGAAATTFPECAENLLALGAAGHACLMRSTDLNETAGNMSVSTPNYGALASMLLGDFRAALQPRRAIACRPLSPAAARVGFYDPDLLDWVS